HIHLQVKGPESGENTVSPTPHGLFSPEHGPVSPSSLLSIEPLLLPSATLQTHTTSISPNSYSGIPTSEVSGLGLDDIQEGAEVLRRHRPDAEGKALQLLDPTNVDALWDRASLAKETVDMKTAPELRTILISSPSFQLALPSSSRPSPTIRWNIPPVAVWTSPPIRRSQAEALDSWNCSSCRSAQYSEEHENAIDVRKGSRIKMGEIDEGKLHANAVLSQHVLDYAPLFAEIADAYFDKELYADARPIYELLGADAAVRFLSIPQPNSFLYPIADKQLMKLAEIYETMNKPRKALELVYEVIDSHKKGRKEAYM
ncbi:hypothetical protein C0991_006559, partial [Blastosporella zonata]